jgi:hypothetical protein
MLLLYELKKILKRITVWGFLGFILAVAAVSLLVTHLLFNNKPARVDHSADYAELKQQIENWDINKTNRADLKTALDEFHNAYKVMNAKAATGVNYGAELSAAKSKFTIFATRFAAIQPEYWFIRPNELESLKNGMTTLRGFYIEERISLAAVNTEWETIRLSNVIDNMFVQELPPAQLDELNGIIAELDANDDNSVSYINCAYQVLYNNYALLLDKNFDGNIFHFTNFTDYNPDTATAAVTLNNYLLEKGLHDNSAHAFAFGDIFNTNNSISLFDFIFTNLEIAAIPLAIIAIIITASAFWTDIHTNVIIETVASRRKRAAIVLTKIFASLIAILGVLLSLILIYTLSGTLLFDATVTPNIVALFNNRTPMVFTPANYFAFYILSLIFKLFVFMLGAGLFSLSKSAPIFVVGFSLLAALLMILTNALFGPVIFYQYVPLLALEPIKYFGAKLFMSPMPTQFNILYTLPLLGALVIIGFFQLVWNFAKKDF